MTPELKKGTEGLKNNPSVPFFYAGKLVDEYRAAGVPPEDVHPQSFHLADVLYWLREHPEYGANAIWLDGRYVDDGFDHTNPTTWSPNMTELVEMGVRTLGPPLWMLLRLDGDGRIVPSRYAEAAKAAGLDLVTWTLERSGPLADGGGWYYQTVAPAIDDDGDMLRVLDILVREVGVRGVFTDWPATVTFYANCAASGRFAPKGAPTGASSP
jgi:glycerophosphoryl diester phosphodiesterase